MLYSVVSLFEGIRPTGSLLVWKFKEGLDNEFTHYRFMIIYYFIVQLCHLPKITYFSLSLYDIDQKNVLFCPSDTDAQQSIN